VGAARRLLRALAPAKARLGRRRLAALTILALPAISGSAVAAPLYASGFYAGTTSQGKTITFMVASRRVHDLYAEIVDGCQGGQFNDYLFPEPAPIAADGTWSHAAAENPSTPTVYHGRLQGTSATGTITDTARNARGRVCKGTATFTTALTHPLHVGQATVGARGTDVPITIGLPPATADHRLVPYTSAALLVYATNAATCPADYRHAGALARSTTAQGYTGLIADAPVDTVYARLPYRHAPRAYRGGAFSFHVATNTILPMAGRRSPFARVCALLYSGKPASRAPGRNITLDSATTPLPFGAGVPRG
jgi:hypothetical protein